MSLCETDSEFPPLSTSLTLIVEGIQLLHSVSMHLDMMWSRSMRGKNTKLDVLQFFFKFIFIC